MIHLAYIYISPNIKHEVAYAIYGKQRTDKYNYYFVLRYISVHAEKPKTEEFSNLKLCRGWRRNRNGVIITLELC